MATRRTQHPRITDDSGLTMVVPSTPSVASASRPSPSRTSLSQFPHIARVTSRQQSMGNRTQGPPDALGALGDAPISSVQQCPVSSSHFIQPAAHPTRLSSPNAFPSLNHQASSAESSFSLVPKRNPDKYGRTAHFNRIKCAKQAFDFFKDSVKRAQERNQR